MELIQETRRTASNLPVSVFTGEGEEVPQPRTFQFCPLGMQFYTRRQMAEYSLLEFTVDLPQDDHRKESICCCGIVVNCRPERDPDLFRVWVKFLDLPESARHRIQCLAKSSDYLCPFCENF